MGQGYTPHSAAATGSSLELKQLKLMVRPGQGIDTWGSTTLPGRDPLKDVITRLNDIRLQVMMLFLVILKHARQPTTTRTISS